MEALIAKVGFWQKMPHAYRLGPPQTSPAGYWKWHNVWLLKSNLLRCSCGSSSRYQRGLKATRNACSHVEALHSGGVTESDVPDPVLGPYNQSFLWRVIFHGRGRDMFAWRIAVRALTA